MKSKKYRPIQDELFVCIDCESTGLDPKKDRIIEVAAALFNLDGVIEEVDWLINPGIDIPPETTKIHHITNEMVREQPSFREVVPRLMEFVSNHLIVGHSIAFDIQLIHYEAARAEISTTILENDSIDTVRLGRHYGETPSNTLEQLRQFFNIEDMGAHRALSDVQVNVAVFEKLAKNFRSIDEILQLLKKPVRLKFMPLGPHKGRPIKEVPLEFLRWAANKNFDEDLLFTIRSEIKRREQSDDFTKSTNPFLGLE